MVKKEPARKYGAPLYGAAWPAGNIFYVAGGGGKPSSGIKNRLIAAAVVDGATTDTVAVSDLDDCPIRMACHPSGQSLILAMNKGGLVRFNIVTPEHGGAPALVRVTGDDTDRFAKYPVAKCLAFSSDGRLLACGWESGSLSVLDWPSAHLKGHLDRSHGLHQVLRDVDFSAGHLNRVIVMACEDGSCSLWDWANATSLLTLQLPTGLKGGKFSQCRFVRDGSLGVFTVVIYEGAGHVLHWEQNAAGDIGLKRRVKATTDPVTSFEMGQKGRCFGLGDTTGEISAWSCQSLSCLSRQKSAHMIFSTAIVIAPDESTILSVSADASAVALSTRKAASPAASIATLLILILVLLFAWYVSA